tara:strand:+ start:867 stop:1109 length:243 start_codon:yes stop_codon:yes gene_type:complete
MAYGSSSGMMKPPKKMQKEKSKMKKLRGLTEAQSKKLMEHSKMHEGGMQGKHMKNMVKFMRAGDTFTVAHNKAKKLDMKK